MRIRLVNPNSDERITATMAAVARAGAPPGVRIEATTSSRAVSLITNARELGQASAQLLKLFDAGLDPLDGVVVSAFGDPAVDELRTRLTVPVIGIAEAALREARRARTVRSPSARRPRNWPTPCERESPRSI